jgi:tRNA pseudouridine32 synthase/23S rRNA pseudouridine746 synthase
MLPAVKVWYADDDLVVVDKPPGLLAVPGRGEAGRACLAAHVAAEWPDALIVHRLDMATSGLMLFARGAEAQRRLSRAFAERRVGKVYTAVAHGLPADDAGEVNAPLAADWPNRPRQQIDPLRGRAALTRWRVLARDSEARRCRLALEPVTGRSHQLRVHLGAIGHPIVGDALYGDDAGREPRSLLHATRLAFAHPRHGTEIVLTSPPPF